MRVSLLSIAASCSGANGSRAPKMLVAHACLFKHAIKGVDPTFCSENAGTTYSPTVRVLWDSDRFTVASSVDVWVSDQTSS